MIAVTAMGIFENVEKAFECISRQDEVKIYLPDDKKILEYERYRAQMNRIYKRVWGEKQKDGRFEFHINFLTSNILTRAELFVGLIILLDIFFSEKNGTNV